MFIKCRYFHRRINVWLIAVTNRIFDHSRTNEEHVIGIKLEKI